MKAFHTIKSEMHENARHMTEPSAASAAPPMQKYRTLREEAATPPDEDSSPFPRWMQAAFAFATHATETNVECLITLRASKSANSRRTRRAKCQVPLRRVRKSGTTDLPVVVGRSVGRDGMRGMAPAKTYCAEYTVRKQLTDWNI